MAGTGRGVSRSESLKNLQDLDILLCGKDAKELVSALKGVSIQLPADQQYYFEKTSGTIHIYGISGPITRFDFSDKSDAGEVRVHGDTLIIKGNYRDKTIVLHQTTKRPPPDAVHIDDYGAPVDAILEYARLHQRGTSGEDTQAQKQAALRRIASEIDVIRSTRESPLARSTPPDTGESRGGSSSSKPG